jgi:hypothetical protein
MVAPEHQPLGLAELGKADGSTEFGHADIETDDIGEVSHRHRLDYIFPVRGSVIGRTLTLRSTSSSNTTEPRIDDDSGDDEQHGTRRTKAVPNDPVPPLIRNELEARGLYAMATRSASTVTRNSDNEFPDRGSTWRSGIAETLFGNLGA